MKELEELYEDIDLAHQYGDRIHISNHHWIEKPAHLSRMEFLQQQTAKGNPT